RRTVDAIGSQTTRLADLQALVQSILAEMESLSVELRGLKPPQEPADDNANAMRHFQLQLRRFEQQQNRILAKLAQLNLNLEVAYRSIAETESKLTDLQSRLGEAQAQESRQLGEE